MSAPDKTAPQSATPSAVIAAPKLPTLPTAAIKDKNLVSPATPISIPKAAIAPTVTPKKSLLQLIEQEFVSVVDLAGTGSNYLFRGVCKKCGWHTHQFSKDAAHDLTLSHAQSHWRDVQRLMS